MAPQSDLTTTRATQASHDTAVDVLQSFPFLKLPAELRNKIYRSLLIFDCTLTPFRPYKQYNFTRKLRQIDVTIIRVNKQIYSEARDIWLKENEFEYQEIYDRFKVGRRGGRGLLIRRRDQQRSIGGLNVLKNASRIRAIFGRNDMIVDFVEILVNNQNLTHLKINFRFMSMDVLMACKKALPRLEKVQVQDEVFFDFAPTLKFRNRSEPYKKKQSDFESYLSALMEKMLEK